MRDGVITLEGPVKNFTKEMLIQGLLPNDAQGGSADGKGVCPGGLCPSQTRHAGEGFQRLRLQQHHVRPVSGRNPRHCGRRRRGPHGTHQHHLRPRQGARRQGDSGRASDITGLSTKQILQAGINFVPEDRHYHGIFKIRSISSNTTSALLSGKDVGAVNMNRRRQSEISQKVRQRFQNEDRFAG